VHYGHFDLIHAWAWALAWWTMQVEGRETYSTVCPNKLWKLYSMHFILI